MDGNHMIRVTQEPRLKRDSKYIARLNNSRTLSDDEQEAPFEGGGLPMSGHSNQQTIQCQNIVRWRVVGTKK